MSGHRLELSYDSEVFEARLLCDDEQASCRWHPRCDCENYHPERDEQGWYHVAYDWELDNAGQVPDVIHRHEIAGSCNYNDWMNDADGVSWFGDVRQGVIATLPVTVDWDGDNWLWRVEK